MLKTVQRLSVVFLIFVWVFSGWPQVWNFPPHVQTAEAAVTFVGSAEASGNSASYDVDLSGLSLQEGDLVIVSSGYAGSGNGNPGVSTAGYTEISDLYANDSIDANFSVNWKVMGASPDSTVTCLGSGSATNGAVCIAYVWRGADRTTPMDVTETEATGTNSPVPNSPSITPSTAGAIVVSLGLGVGSAGDTSVTAPAGYSNQADNQVDPGNAPTVGVASKAWSGSGAEDPAAWTNWTQGTASADSWAAVSVAVRPARAPTVSTESASSITTTSATLNGTISATGGISSTVRGFAWGTNAALSGGDTATTTENGTFSTGAFTNSSLTLSCNTTYYTRAYATNAIGTGLGAISSSFTTSACAAAPTISVTEPDGTNDTVTSGDMYSIGYTLADSDSVVTASFAYDTDASGEDGTPIVGACSGVAEGTGTCSWDTTGVTPGTYYIYATTTDGVTTVADYSPGQVTIEASAPVYSVEITSSGTISYGFVELGTASSTVGNGYTQTAHNDGNAAEKLNVKSSDASGGTSWTLASSIGSNQFKHEFSTTTGSTWTTMPDSATYVTAVPSLSTNGTATFDFRITTPNATSDYQQKSVTITVQAVAP